MNLRNIWSVGAYESKTLFRSWFFRIFSILALLILFGTNMGFFGGHSGARWTLRAIPACMPWINVLFINVGQAIIAVFLASDFLRRDKKLDTTEVIYARPITNGEYVVGKTLGILVLFVGLVLLALVMSLVFNLVNSDAPVVWKAYLYYPVLITLPTLIFILGLSFFMMILFRSQAVTFLVLLGYIGLSLAYFKDKLYGLLDYMAFNLPMVYSDFIGFADPLKILMHRLTYLLLGIAFIFATIRFLSRLPQTGRWNFLNLFLFLAFLGAGTATGYLYYRSLQEVSLTREKYLELNNRFVNRYLVDVLSNTLEVEQKGKKLTVSSTVWYMNRGDEKLDTLIFSLNPGFSIDSITSRRGDMDFRQLQQLVMLFPEKGLEAGRRGGVTFHYSGVPDGSIAYLDIPREKVDALKRAEVAPFDKETGIIHPEYLLLTPELNWYPRSGVGFNLKDFQPQKMDFARFELTIWPDSGLSAIAPGRIDTLDRGFRFVPEQDLSVFPLVIAPLEKRSLVVDQVEYNLYIHPDHDYFSPYFSEIGDTIESLIREEKDNYEIDELDLYYPFKRLNLVEVPVQFHPYERPYNQTYETILPEMLLLPEKGAGLNTMDFKRFKKIEERRDRERDNKRSDREIQVDQFKRFLQNTFFQTSYRTRESGRGGRGEDIIIYDRDQYSRNPYSVFPLYYSYVTCISSEEYPALNSMVELYLKEGFDVSPRQGFQGGITDKERANLALMEKSMEELFGEWDTELTSALINQTGSFIISALKNRVGMSDFDYFLYYYLEDHAFSEITFEQFARDFREEFDVEIRPYLEVIRNQGGMASFLISDPEFIQTKDDIGDVYLVKFNVSNLGDARGLLDLNFRIMGSGGFGGPGGMEEEKRLYEVKAGENREVQVVLYERPMLMTVNTLISANIPSSYNHFLRSAVEAGRVNMDEFDRPVDKQVSLSYLGEYLVDNEDPGFSHFSVPRTSRLKQFIEARRPQEETGLKYGQLNEWWTPVGWTPVAHSAYYGGAIRSAMAIRSGDGSNYASWSTVLPEKGFYDIYVYVPVGAMLRRPDRGGRDNQNGGRGSGGGGDRRGPQFADNGADYHYTLNSSQGSEEIVYELRNPEEGWNRIGSYHLPADTVSMVLTNESSGRRVIADAVKFVRR